MNALVGYYPRDLQRRSQLLTALLGKDAMSLSAHINKFNSKKKKEERGGLSCEPNERHGVFPTHAGTSFRGLARSFLTGMVIRPRTE